MRLEGSIKGNEQSVNVGNKRGFSDEKVGTFREKSDTKKFYQHVKRPKVQHQQTHKNASCGFSERLSE